MSLFEFFYLYSFDDEFFCSGAYYLLDLWNMVPRVTQNTADVGFSFLKLFDSISTLGYDEFIAMLFTENGGKNLFTFKNIAGYYNRPTKSVYVFNEDNEKQFDLPNLGFQAFRSGDFYF